MTTRWLLSLLSLFLFAPVALAQVPETIAYQGYLTDDEGTPLEGTVDLTFRLYDAALEGTAMWAESQPDVPVSDGIFSVRLGRAEPLADVAFDRPLWLAVYVNGGDELAPRVALSAVPYALSLRGLRLEPAPDPGQDGPNVIVGHLDNDVAEGVVGATISGGGDPDFGGPIPNHVEGSYGTVGGGAGNTAVSFGTVGGGIGNEADGSNSTVGGGSRNRAADNGSAVAGGLDNAANGAGAFVGGGSNNTASGIAAATSGGSFNAASGERATVPGGRDNQAGGAYSLAAGRRAKVRDAEAAGDDDGDEGTFVWADSENDDFTSTGPDQFLIRAAGGVGIGTNTPTSPLTVSGVVESTEGGFMFPDGSIQTTAAAEGGSGQTAWLLGGNAGTTAGTDFLGTTDAVPLELRAGGEGVMRYEPTTADEGPNVVGGWNGNFVSAGVVGATISGGGDPAGADGSNPNRVTGNSGTVGGGAANRAAHEATVAGGFRNVASGLRATVGGGIENTADAAQSTVGGGSGNTASDAGATVAGGVSNTASGINTAVGGGFSNTASGVDATIGGGAGNAAEGRFSTIPGGRLNRARGEYTFAAGRRAKADHDGTFVWTDDTNADFASTSDDQFLIRAAGGVGIGTNSPDAALHVVRSVDASATVGNHVALIENTSGTASNGPDVLALKTSAASPDGRTNFITFFDANDDAVGSIEGTDGGITLRSGSGDFAERLERLDPAEQFVPGDVVGVFGGRISRQTSGAERLMVVSERPIVTGNAPADAAAEAATEIVAFVGQVPVRVVGRVEVDDVLVASGQEDGRARAVSPTAYTPAVHGPIVGRAWSATSGGAVTALVGLDEAGMLAHVVRRQQLQIDALQSVVGALQTQVAELRALVARTAAAPPAGSGEPAIPDRSNEPMP